MTDEEIEKQARDWASDWAWDGTMYWKLHDSDEELLGMQFAMKAFIAGAKWARQNAWIKCSERLPEVGQRTLLLHNLNAPNPMVGVRLPDHPNVWWHSEEAIFCGLESVTHWMPLPEPPKEGPKS